MSSYGNHVWTQDRESAARKLVQAAMDCDDDGFAEILHGIASVGSAGAVQELGGESPTLVVNFAAFNDLLAVTALLAEKLAEFSEREIEAI
jgi:hypothetical protein